MAEKKKARSSKTDRVLNLLSGIIPEAEAQEESAPKEQPAAEQPSAPETAADPAPQSAPAAYAPRHPVVPILEVAHNNQEILEESIRDALENDLEAQLAEEEKTTEPEPPLPEQTFQMPVPPDEPAPDPELSSPLPENPVLQEEFPAPEPEISIPQAEAPAAEPP